MKKNLLLLFAFISFSSVSAYDFAAENEDGKIIYYNIALISGDDVFLAVTYKDENYNSYTGEIKIPEEVDYDGKKARVRSIGTNAFKDCSDLTLILPNSIIELTPFTFSGIKGSFSLTLPENMKNVGERMFQGNTNLTSIIINGNIERIYYMFDGCTSLKSVSIPNSVSTIDFCAFNGCTSLESITLPEQLQSIGDFAFMNCSSLTSITLPENVGGIGNEAFTGCINLQSIKILSNKCPQIFERSFDKYDMVIYIREELIMDYKTIFFWKRFSSFKNLNGEDIEEPIESDLAIDNGEGKPIYYNIINNGEELQVTFKNSAHNSYSGSLTIPEEVTYEGKTRKVTSIGPSAFRECLNLTSITIPGSITNIGEYAFQSCDNLKKVIIKDIAAWCNMTFGSDDANPIYNAEHIFSDENTEITDLVIPEGVTIIRANVFQDCEHLRSITISSSVTTIGKNAFRYAKGLLALTLPEGLLSIGNTAFEDCRSLTKVDIPSTLKRINKGVFRDCEQLVSLTIPEGVTYIGDEAFQGCRILPSVKLPKSITSIGNDAFQYCERISSITSKIENPCSLPSECFTEDVFANAKLYVPVGTLDKYKATDYWNKFTNIVEETIIPLTQSGEITISEEINENTNLDNTVIENVYYNVADDNGYYDTTEQCLTISQPTDDNDAAGDAGSKSDTFTGMIMQVSGGTGKVMVKAQTTGTMKLKVRVGENSPEEITLNNVETVTIPYNVTEPSNIYIYAGSTTSAGAKSFGKHITKVNGANSLKIYGISWEIESIISGIKAIDLQNSANLKCYDLQGRSVQTPGDGVYIVNGKKVLIRKTKP